MTIAAAAKRCTLENGTAPAVPPLPDADMSDMEYFIDQLQIALPVLSVNILRGVTETVQQSTPTAESTTSPVFELAIAKRGIHARAQQIDGEFTLLAGSVIAGSFAANAKYAASTTASYAAYEARHEQLVAEGSIIVNRTTGTLTRNVTFRSCPVVRATVASVADADGQTFGAWEDRGLGDG